MTKEHAHHYLRNFIDRYNQQDNRATAMPYFIVIKKEKWRVCHDEFYSGDTKLVRVDFNGDPTHYDSLEEFIERRIDGHPAEKRHRAIAELTAEWNELPEYRMERYTEDENCFFTYEGYREHIRLNGHNVREHFNFVEHAFRNPELENLFTAIGVLVDQPWRGAPDRRAAASTPLLPMSLPEDGVA